VYWPDIHQRSIQKKGDMAAPVSAIPSSSPNKGSSRVVERRWADYHPSIWGDYFLAYASPTNSVVSSFSYGHVNERINVRASCLLLLKVAYITHAGVKVRWKSGGTD